MTTSSTPREVDTELARLYTATQAAAERRASHADTLLRAAGAAFVYRGRRRVTSVPAAEALETLRPIVAANADESSYTRGLFPYDGFNLGQIRSSIAGYDEKTAEIKQLREATEVTEAKYTGWSRFFLVTSSAGHVHSSMNCSTCRPTTTFGWLPGLSGKDEATAVAQLGPTLCTVCFPSAPLTWTAGRRITAAQAAKIAA